MKKIAVFMDYLPSIKSGGPVKQVVNMVEALGDFFEIYVVSRDHDFGETTKFSNIEEGWNIVGKAKVCYLSDKEVNKQKYGEILDEIKPSAVYTMTVFSIKMVFSCIFAARKRNIPILIAPCGQTCHNSLMLKKWKKLPYLFVMKHLNFFKNIFFFTTSDEEYESMIKYLNIKTKYLFNLPNIPQKNSGTKNAVKEKGKLKVLFVSRVHRKKNLLYAIDIMKRVKCDCVYDIYGPLEDTEYWEKCKKSINTGDYNAKINYKRALAPDEASNIYSEYDCFFFPTLSENYGFVIEESLLSDCPVILSKGTTPWDDYSEYVDCVFDLNEPEKFVEAIERFAAMSAEEFDQVILKTREYVLNKINYEYILEEHKKMYTKVIKSISINKYNI